tara:strand:+ start:885 stop:3197 length:2313 start_codon:yes stop_codon:yes gene_type:complete
MGLMSIVNTLASSPVGKIAGGYMEGKIDEKKEEARLQEKKDDRYAAITDGLVNNLLTIEANTIAEATKENDLYKEAVKWAVGKFGDGGYAVAEKMRTDGAFSGMKSFQDVLNYVGKLDDYGANLPEGSDPWYKQSNWTEFAEKGKDYRAPNNIYTERLDTSYKNIGKILKDNGIGDNTFNLLSGFDTSRATYNEDVGRIVATDQTSAEAVGTDPATVSSTLPVFTSPSTQMGIKGFSESSYSRQVEKQINQMFPTFTNMFLIDNTGVARLNKTAFGDDVGAFERASSVEQYLNRTLAGANNAYASNKIKDVNNPYNKFTPMYNPNDFDEVGFIQQAVDDYSSVVDAQKDEIIKLNILSDDLKGAITDGVIPTSYLAELSEYLDDTLGSTWSINFLNNLGISDERSIFKARYNDAVNKFLTDEKRLGKQSYKHKMKFIDPTENIDDVMDLEKMLKDKLITQGEYDNQKGNNKPYIDYYTSVLTNTITGDFGQEDINIFLDKISPKNYEDINELSKQLGVEEFPIIMPGALDASNFEVNTFNAESIADSKFSKTNVQIDNMQPIGGKILANNDIRTTADVLAFVEQYNGNVSAIKQAVIGLIINDVFEGNIANMSNSDMVNLADSVMLDIGTLMSDSYGSTENSENTSVGENIVTNTDSKEDSVVEEDKKDDIVLAEVLQKGTEEESTKSEGIGDEPYLFSDGSFNPNFDPSILEGGEFEAGTPRRDYEIAKARYEARQRVLKNKEDTEKIKKGATFIWENLIKGDKFKKDN